LNVLIRLLAPVLPYAAEELLADLGDADADLADLASSAIGAVRKAKANNGIQRRENVPQAVLEAPEPMLVKLRTFIADIRAAGRITEIVCRANDDIDAPLLTRALGSRQPHRHRRPTMACCWEVMAYVISNRGGLGNDITRAIKLKKMLIPQRATEEATGSHEVQKIIEPLAASRRRSPSRCTERRWATTLFVAKRRGRCGLGVFPGGHDGREHRRQHGERRVSRCL
jgi:hypothetical protein